MDIYRVVSCQLQSKSDNDNCFYCMMQSAIEPWSHWVLSITPNRPVRNQYKYPRKMERQFLIKPGQWTRMALTTFYSFFEFRNLGNETVSKNGRANFDRNLIPTDISGPPPEVFPNIPVLKYQKRNIWISTGILGIFLPRSQSFQKGPKRLFGRSHLQVVKSLRIQFI